MQDVFIEQCPASTEADFIDGYGYTSFRSFGVYINNWEPHWYSALQSISVCTSSTVSLQQK